MQKGIKGDPKSTTATREISSCDDLTSTNKQNYQRLQLRETARGPSLGAVNSVKKNYKNKIKIWHQRQADKLLKYQFSCHDSSR